jgi:hypothetical protein
VSKLGKLRVLAKRGFDLQRRRQSAASLLALEWCCGTRHLLRCVGWATILGFAVFASSPASSSAQSFGPFATLDGTGVQSFGVQSLAAAAPVSSAAATLSTPSLIQLASSYNMTFDNTTYDIMADGSLSGITEDQQGNISGQMTVDPPLEGTGPFTGTVSNTTINFALAGTDGSYTGTVNAQGTLSGTYTYSAPGPFAGQSGTWQATADVDPTSPTVACSPTSVATGSAATCTATVTDTASSGPITPTGTVSFTALPTTGSFGSSGSCTLAATSTTGTASCQLTFTPSAAGGYTITGSYGGDGAHATSEATKSLTAQTAPPANTAPPRVTGPTTAGGTLSCSRGSWKNNPTAYAYQWYRNGTLLAGFTASTYKLGTLDEGTTLTCVVTASNAGGQASAQSNAVKIPIPKVPRCPGATGSMTGTTIGQITLGMTLQRARYLYRRHSNRGRQYQDFFCLTPIGVRVGYASPILLDILPKHERAKYQGRVVWASTSNPYYSLDGVRPGESIQTASRALGTEPPFHIGLNYWYLARKASYTAVLNVRGTVVQELGIADNALTKTRKTQNVLMHSFY